jgi:hypothetical protein
LLKRRPGLNFVHRDKRCGAITSRNECAFEFGILTRTHAIVFDMDGVLIDSEELHARAKRIAFAHARSALSDADLRSYVAGALRRLPNSYENHYVPK